MGCAIAGPWLYSELSCSTNNCCFITTEVGMCEHVDCCRKGQDPSTWVMCWILPLFPLQQFAQDADQLTWSGEYSVLFGADMSIHMWASISSWNHWKLFFQKGNPCVVLSILQECINGVSKWQLKVGYNLCLSLVIHKIGYIYSSQSVFYGYFLYCLWSTWRVMPATGKPEMKLIIMIIIQALKCVVN